MVRLTRAACLVPAILAHGEATDVARLHFAARAFPDGWPLRRGHGNAGAHLVQLLVDLACLLVIPLPVAVTAPFPAPGFTRAVREDAEGNATDEQYRVVLHAEHAYGASCVQTSQNAYPQRSSSSGGGASGRRKAARVIITIAPASVDIERRSMADVDTKRGRWWFVCRTTAGPGARPWSVEVRTRLSHIRHS